MALDRFEWTQRLRRRRPRRIRRGTRIRRKVRDQAQKDRKNPEKISYMVVSILSN
jgi:hypothetical protein